MMAQTINVPAPISAAVPFAQPGTPSGLTQFGIKQLSDTQVALAALIAQVAALNAKVGL
jgi:hypothetical protein